MRSMELFAGAGGLALGSSKAGFKHEAVVEWDRWCCDTMRENQRKGEALVKGWSIHEMDARDFDYSTINEGLDLVSAGPPCQPFSLGGKHRGRRDRRDMFPEVFHAVRQLRPRAILVENVKGLLRESFASYFNYVFLQLSYPEIEQRSGENWKKHHSRLQQHHSSGSSSGLTYQVNWQLLNAANYGVPQRRERVFIVGFRSDLGIEWSFESNLAPTHSHDALVWDQEVDGGYWERHEVPKGQRRALPARLKNRVNSLQWLGEKPTDAAWLTVRDAISDLPNPKEKSARKYHNHEFNPGARRYKGHTGSPLDEPAKTLKAGDHGVPGGENMLAYPNGKVRYFSVRESARLQMFPDDYVFHGAWSETMRQLGNAVPVTLAEAAARSIRNELETQANMSSAFEKRRNLQPAA